jgi:hypothetical protein
MNKYKCVVVVEAFTREDHSGQLGVEIEASNARVAAGRAIGSCGDVKPNAQGYLTRYETPCAVGQSVIVKVERVE